MCQHIFEKNIIKSLKHKVIIDIMHPLYKFAKGETTMSQIKLTPEDLRTSAQKYTRGSEDVSQVLSSLKHEQEVIRGNWDGSAFRSFDAQFEALSPKIEEFAHLLQDINAQLLKVADIVEETDESIASQIH
jgi:WXG100 family type VII secretion target